MRHRRSFSMIEVLITLSILVITTALVFPQLNVMTRDVPAATLRSSVDQIRRQIRYHAMLGDVPLSMEGYPNTIETIWFRGGMLPRNPWTQEPFNIQVVHGAKTATRPNKKTFQVRAGKAAGHTAWYNAANGAFVALVPDRGSEQSILEQFDYINGEG